MRNVPIEKNENFWHDIQPVIGVMKFDAKTAPWISTELTSNGLTYDTSLFRRPGITLGGIPRGTLPSNISVKSTHILHPSSLFFTMTGLATHFAFRVEGFPIDRNVSGDPCDISTSLRKDICIVLRRFHNLFLKCSGSCFPMVALVSFLFINHWYVFSPRRCCSSELFSQKEETVVTPPLLGL
ncbi:hypothetical protein Tco_0849446 [Tanacetum coccineum]